jgi:two-component system cell cycle sensor histidine kinase/response regulator CckA
MIQPALHRTPSVVPAAPLWSWVAVALAVIFAGVAAYSYRSVRRREETIRRQLARESALKARFDDVFDRSTDVIIVHDRRGRVSTINRAGQHVTGYSREDVRGLDPNWIFSNDYLDTINRMLAEGAEALPQAFRSELSPRRGNRVPVDVHARVLVGDGQVVGVMAIARDLSERERLENELRQAQKMVAVGRLATGIAHDFNNLITVLIGYSDELIEEAPSGSPAHTAAVAVRRAAERASGLTQQLLSFSRRQTLVSHTVDLNRIITHMEDMLRRLLGPEIRLDIRLQPTLAAINADESQISQVVMNLVVNARDAMPKGGTLTIETTNIELGEEHLEVIPGPHILLTVADTGFGMTADVRDRLFEPFFTTKERGHGTGLGLSMVHGIVRQCSGHIVVDSKPGSGTRFLVYFPQQREASAPAVPTAIAHHSVSVRGEGVILLAEDDPSVRRLVVTELTRRGFTVIEAADGRAALEIFQREKDAIDVLVTDVVMPRLNGADLAKEVERIRPGLKILFISGHPERAGSGLDPAGITNLLMKPFTADTLAARIKGLMAEGKEADGWRA